jgi:hypothetical protein
MSVETLLAQLKQLETQRDAYLETFNKAHKAVADTLAKQGERRATRPSLEVPVSLPGSPTLQTPIPSLSVVPPALSRKPSTVGGPGYRDGNFDASTVSDDSESEDEDDEFFVKHPLPTRSFDHEHLRHHLKTYQFDSHGRQILTSVINDRGRLKNPSLFPTSAEEKNYSHYQVFDVGGDGVPIPIANDPEHNVSRAHQTFLAIKDINVTPKDEHAVGRITYVRMIVVTSFKI